MYNGVAQKLSLQRPLEKSTLNGCKSVNFKARVFSSWIWIAKFMCKIYFLQLSSNLNHFFVIKQRPNFFGNNLLIWDKIKPILSQAGGLIPKKIGLCYITKNG